MKSCALMHLAFLSLICCYYYLYSLAFIIIAHWMIVALSVLMVQAPNLLLMTTQMDFMMFSYENDSVIVEKA